MRPLEIAILVLTLGSLIELLISVRAKPRWRAFVPGLLVVVVIAQFVGEGYRWQMLPLYVGALVVSALSFKRFANGKVARPRRRREVVFAILGLGLIVIAAAPPALFPIPQLPTPSGAYRVGTVTYDWVDNSRDEMYASTPGKRELMVQIWYPALPAADAQPAPWMDRLDVLGPAIARYLKLPAFFLDHLTFTRMNSYPNAPVSNQVTRYPVVVYSHGWNGFRAVNASRVQSAYHRASSATFPRPSRQARI